MSRPLEVIRAENMRDARCRSMPQWVRERSAFNVGTVDARLGDPADACPFRAPDEVALKRAWERGHMTFANLHRHRGTYASRSMPAEAR